MKAIAYILVEAITDSQAVGFVVIGLVDYFDKLFWMDKLSQLFSTT